MLAWEAPQMPPQLSESDAGELKEKKAQPDSWASDREERPVGLLSQLEAQVGADGDSPLRRQAR